jgi:hypothetical protein
MSRSWLWDQKDDQKVVAWTAKASEEALLAGDSILASEILKGASNFFALRAFGDTAGGNSELVSKWLWGIHSDIYAGTANIYDLSVEPIHTLRSVPYCFKLLNSFFDLNDLFRTGQTASEPILDLIIPEPYEDDGIIG